MQNWIWRLVTYFYCFQFVLLLHAIAFSFCTCTWFIFRSACAISNSIFSFATYRLYLISWFYFRIVLWRNSTMNSTLKKSSLYLCTFAVAESLFRSNLHVLFACIFSCGNLIRITNIFFRFWKKKSSAFSWVLKNFILFQIE